MSVPKKGRKRGNFLPTVAEEGEEREKKREKKEKERGKVVRGVQGFAII